MAKHKPAKTSFKTGKSRKKFGKKKSFKSKKPTKRNDDGEKKLKVVSEKKENFVDDIVNEDVEIDVDDSDLDHSEEDELSTTAHKKNLEELKKKDPEFYQYLQQHDKELLDFDDDEEVEPENDEIDDEEVGDETQSENITLKTVTEWRKVLQNSSAKANCLSAIKSVIKAFRKTVNQTTDTSDNIGPSSMSMLDPSVFNVIINTALVDLLPALMHFLRLQNLKSAKEVSQKDDEDKSEEEEKSEKQTSGQYFDPRRSRNWKRVVATIKIYLTDVLKMMDSLSSEARVSFERHVLELVPFYNSFPHLIKRLIRRSMKEWCSGEEQNRVIAFLILHRSIRVIHSNDHMTKQERQTLINQVLRKLYLTFVSISRNTNETTIAQIGFMRNSLMELYCLDDELAYQHAFIFIRQLAINLRSAYILKQKNSLKTVYNWQFIHSILLWVQLISQVHHRTDVLQQLISPLVTVIMGTIGLLSTVKFIPLRLHLIRALVKLSESTDTHIPLLRYLFEIYSLLETSVKRTGKGKQAQAKKSNKAKPINLDVLLKVTREQTTETEFVQKVSEKLYDLSLYYATVQSYKISFPELVIFFVQKTRQFAKSPLLQRLPKERTMLNQLVDKINQNSQFITDKRIRVQFSVNDKAQLNAWEREVKQSENAPLVKFYKNLKNFKLTLNKETNGADEETGGALKMASQLAKDKRPFDVQVDLKKDSINKTVDEDVEPEDDIEDDLEDDDEEMIEFGSDEEELTEEQMDGIQKRIEVEQKKLKALNDESEDDDDGEQEVVAKSNKRKRRNRNRKHKPRKLNNDLRLEGAFELSSDEEK